MENKTGKYFKYAIGEIVLVVIGILIALSINNWNENRLEKIEEHSFLSNLRNEFSQNKKALKTVLEMFDRSLKADFIIMDLFGQNREELKRINTDSILSHSYYYEKFNSSENALSGLIQSGKLQLLQNEKLKYLLYDWSRTILSAEGLFEDLDVKIENDVTPYLTKNHSIKDIDYYGDLKWKSKSILKSDKLKIFEDIEYENLMSDLTYRKRAYYNALKTADLIIDSIIQETKSQ